MTTALRNLLVSRGAIRPLANRKTLRLDDRGRATAAQHIAEYSANPDRYVNSRFEFDVDAWMFPQAEEDE